MSARQRDAVARLDQLATDAQPAGSGDEVRVPPLAHRVLDALARGETPPAGSQTGRRASCPAGGPTTLKQMVDANHDYRGEWA